MTGPWVAVSAQEPFANRSGSPAANVNLRRLPDAVEAHVALVLHNQQIARLDLRQENVLVC